MGIELDVLVGHPEHELLFVATQVARSAGLKEASHAVCQFAKYAVEKTQAVQVAKLGNPVEKPQSLKATLKGNSWLFNETATYDMLLRGHAPQSEPFRKWVTEEVLPTIRKTGKYNAEESSNPIAQGVIDQLRTVIRASIAKNTIDGSRLASSPLGPMPQLALPFELPHIPARALSF